MPIKRPPDHILSPDLRAALVAGQRWVEETGQEVFDVEHLLLGILESEAEDGLGHQLLRQLPVNFEELKTRLKSYGTETTGRRAVRNPPLSACCGKVFDWALAACFNDNAVLLTNAHAMEGILMHESLAVHAIRTALETPPEPPAVLPGWWKRIQGGLQEMGVGWEVPIESLQLVGDALGGRGAFFRHLRHPETVRIDGIFNGLEIWLHPQGETLSVLVRKSLKRNVTFRWLLKRWILQLSDRLQMIPEAKPLFAPIFWRKWERNPPQPLGKLNRDFFASRKPCGEIRRMEPRDVPACRALYRLLEELKRVPSTHQEDFDQWTEKDDTMRFVTELEGHLIGCCGVSFLRSPEDEPSDNPAPPVGFVVSYGLVHPDHGSKGVGISQIAARCILAAKSGAFIGCATGTEYSVPYLQRIGFSFTHTYQENEPDVGKRGLSDGAIRLTDEDCQFLEEWLGTGRTA